MRIKCASLASIEIRNPGDPARYYTVIPLIGPVDQVPCTCLYDAVLAAREIASYLRMQGHTDARADRCACTEGHEQTEEQREYSR